MAWFAAELTGVPHNGFDKIKLKISNVKHAFVIIPSLSLVTNNFIFLHTGPIPNSSEAGGFDTHHNGPNQRALPLSQDPLPQRAW